MHLFLQNLNFPNIIFPSIVIDGQSFAITFPIRMCLIEKVQIEAWYKIPLIDFITINYKTREILWAIKSSNFTNLGKITDSLNGWNKEFESFFDGMTKLMLDGVKQNITNEQFYSEFLQLLQENVLPCIIVKQENLEVCGNIYKQQEEVAYTLETELKECTLQFKNVLENKILLINQLINENLLSLCPRDILLFLIDDINESKNKELNTLLKINCMDAEFTKYEPLYKNEQILTFINELNKIQEKISLELNSNLYSVVNSDLLNNLIEQYKKCCELQESISEKLLSTYELFPKMMQLKNTSLDNLKRLQLETMHSTNNTPFQRGKTNVSERLEMVENILQEYEHFGQRHLHFLDYIKTQCEIIEKHQHLWMPTSNNQEFIQFSKMLFDKSKISSKIPNVDNSLDNEVIDVDAEICSIMKNEIYLEEAKDSVGLDPSLILKVKNPNIKYKNFIISTSMFLREFRQYIYTHIENFTNDLQQHMSIVATDSTVNNLYDNYEIYFLNAIFPNLLTVFSVVCKQSWEKMKTNMTKMTHFTVNLSLLKHFCKNPFHNHKLDDNSSIYCQYVQSYFKHTIDEIENLASSPTFSDSAQSLQDIVNILGLELSSNDATVVPITPVIHLILIHCQPYFIHKLYITIKCLMNFLPSYLCEGNALYSVATFNVALAYFWSDLLVFNRLQC